MAKLVRCFECNKQLSSSASECPHCKTRYTNGITCAFCTEKLRKSESYQLSELVDRIDSTAKYRCIRDTFNYDSHRISKFSYDYNYLSGDFCASCSKKVQEAFSIGQADVNLPKPKVVVCPTCRKGKFEIPYTRNFSPPSGEKFYCGSCGESFWDEISDAEWPYSNCFYCHQLVVKRDSIKFKDHYAPFDKDPKNVYAHNICFSSPANSAKRSQSSQKRRREKYLNFWGFGIADPISN